MQTVGNIIKEARLSENITREELGEMTHIKTSFIAAIENSKWEELPQFSTALGFVKSISHFLNIPENQAVSLFRREYPPKLKGSFDYAQDDRKKEIGRGFVWGPRMTFLAGILIILSIVFGYLGFQYRKFNMPPALTVSSPTQNEVINNFNLDVKGKTDPDATIVVNDQPVTTDSSGYFSTQINVASSTTQVKIVAKSRSGRVTTIARTIKVSQ